MTEHIACAMFCINVLHGIWQADVNSDYFTTGNGTCILHESNFQSVVLIQIDDKCEKLVTNNA